MKYFLYIFLAFLLLVFTFVVPPFQKPDEPVHFYRVITLFNGQLSCDTSSGRPHFNVPLSIFNFPKTMVFGDIASSTVKFPISLYKKSFPWTGDKQTDTSDTHCTLPWYAYIPQVLITAATYPFNNMLITFYGMRLANAILFFLCFLIALRVSPRRYQSIFWVFAFIPMVLHQATAVSYDAPSLALGMVMIAYFLSLITKSTLSLKQVLLFFGILTFFNAVKGGYYPTFLLAIPIAIKLKIRWNRAYLIITAVTAVLVFVVIVQQLLRLQLLDFISPSTLLRGTQVTIADPLYFLRVVSNTLSEDADVLLHQLIGQFGWLDYRASPYIFAGYFVVVGFLVSTLLKDNHERINGRFVALLWFVILSAFLLIAYVYYTQATPPAYYKIVSLQGRYILPIFPLILFTILQSLAYLSRLRLGKWIAIFIVIVLFSVSLTRSIFTRYYDYSKSIINYNPLIEQIHKDPKIIEKWTAVALDKETKFILPSEPSIGSKISGFQLVPANEFEATIPYSYSVADATCTRVYTKGYLDHLRGKYLKHVRFPDDPVYTQFFSITRVPSGAVCLTFRPISPLSKYNIPLNIYTDGKKPVIRLLYLIQ